MLNAKFTGVDTVILNIKNLEARVKNEVAKELNAAGQDIVTSAKRRAPVDEGLLRNSISTTNASPENLKITISVNVFYAAYVEFGTRKFAAQYVSSLPQEWQTFAAQFKGGSGGSFEEFVQRLVQWVLKKGFSKKVGKQSKQTTAEADAYAIAIYIIRNGIRPHPYFVPAVDEGRRKFIENLNRIKL